MVNTKLLLFEKGRLLTVHSKICLIHELVNSSSIPSRPIGDMKRGDIIIVHLDAYTRFNLEIALEFALIAPAVPVAGIRASTKRPPPFKECSAHVVVCQLFQDEEPREAFHSGNGTFKDLRIRSSAHDDESLVRIRFTVGSMLSRWRVGTYTSKDLWEYLESRISYEGERRVISTVLH